MNRYIPRLQTIRWMSLPVGLLLAVCASAAWIALGTTKANAASSCKAKCFVTQIDTCAQNGGQPPPCEVCRGLFQPCWDQYCYLEDKRCIDSPDGGQCTETVVSNNIGLWRVCVAGDVDWYVCLGQNRCKSETINPQLGPNSRFGC